MPTSEHILRTYIVLTLLSTFAMSFVWGINTLFLLDAGLSITQAFAVNAFFTVGQVVFEVPTGVAADTVGRRISFLLGAATLLGATLLYLLMWHLGAPFWAWAAVSMLLGLGYTFFSGVTEAWLVDGLHATQYRGSLEAAFAKGQIAEGVAMLTGTVAGGAIAQVTTLGMPFIARAVALALTFAVAFAMMRDIGFAPKKRGPILRETRTVLRASLDYGLHNRPVRWLMLTGPFVGGVGMYAFYAMQPYLLELYGSSESYFIAGLAAGIVAGAQIVGGLLVPYGRRLFRRRTTLLLAASVVSGVALAFVGLLPNFYLALVLLSVWGIVYAMSLPVRQAFINGLIPSAHRATVLSSDNLLNASGGVVAQPALGKVADVWGYPASYVVGAIVELMALPFILLARRERAASDAIEQADKELRRRRTM